MKSLLFLFLIFLFLAVLFRVLLALVFPPILIDGQEIKFTTTLLTEPTGSYNYKSVNLPYSNGFGSTQIKLFFPPNSDLHYGDKVTFSGKITILQPKNSSRQASGVLGNKKQVIAIYSPSFKVNVGQENPFFSASYFFRHKFKQIYEKLFSQKLSSLLIGVVLGVKGNFPKEFLTDLQATGVMHVIAASGMNVTMVGGFFMGLFAVFLGRRWAVVLTILVLLFYCFVSGLQASIIRATIMIGFALGAQFFGRQYSGLYGLVLAACGMLLINPMWSFDVGFQLSFAATLGILFIKPIIPKIRFVSEDVTTTIAAQIATLPILLSSFGSLGLLSILVNALVLWTIPPLMIFGGVGGLIGIAFEPLGQFILLLCMPFLWFFEWIVVFFGNLHWQIAVSSVPEALIVGYYLMLISFVWFLKQKIKPSQAKVSISMPES